MSRPSDAADAVTHKSAGVADTLQAGGASDSGPGSSRHSVELEEGTVLDGVYRVVKRIGGGAMGTVYLVEHVQLGRRFAAKVVASVHSADPEIIGRLRNEARVASSIQHENIVDVTHLGRTPEGSLFVVMELLEGHDLRHRLTEQEANAAQPWLDDEDSRRIARDVLTGLHAAHEVGIVHRDLKPDNIFLAFKNGKERAKLVDFGISKGARGDADEMRLTRTGQIIGTPLYMAPEQTRGSADVDRRADLYAIGVILYELTTGRLPFEATSIYDLIVKHATEAPPPARERRPDLPAPVEAVIMRCLEKQPDARYQTAQEVLDAWEKAWAGVAPSVRPPPVVSSRPPSVPVPTPTAAEISRSAPTTSASRGPLVGAVLVGALALAGIGAFALGGGGGTTSTPPTTVLLVAPVLPPPTSVAPPPTEVSPPPTTAVGVAPPADVIRTIVSAPPGATVEVGGSALGTTPLALTLPSGQPVEITLRASGRRPVTQTITDADPDTVNITLTRATHGHGTGGDLPTLAPH